MSLDLSHTDAQLDALGVVLDDGALRARHYSHTLDLPSIDRELSEVEAGVPEPALAPQTRGASPPSSPPPPLYLSFPAAEQATLPPASRPSVAGGEGITARRPESGEISLGEPVIRGTRAAGEQALDSKRPKSGSYELGPAEGEVAAQSPENDSAPPQPTLRPQRVEADRPAPKVDSVLAFFDDIEAPAALADDPGDLSTLTSVSASTLGASHQFPSDADAAFNALFDDAPEAQPADSDLEFESSYEEGDATEIIEIGATTGQPPPAADPFPAEDVLGSTDFEIVPDEEPSEEATKATPAQPPALPPGRPSFLGRLFGKKDEKE